ncbi:MAG: hypothetical protein ACOC80_12810 [Petrotogales bacterium]
MTIKNKLNTAWGTNETMKAVFEFRAQAENAYNVLQETVARIDEIVAESNFQNVDSEIKSEGSAIKDILKQAKEALDSHSDFINWRQLK